MKTALILHGIKGSSGENWFPWLKGELEQKGWKVILPDLPGTNHPSRKKWLTTVKNLLRDVDFSSLSIIGHSLGVTTALDLIETEGKKVNILVSASGFARDYHAELNSYFLREKEVDLSRVKKLIEKPIVIYGDDDPYVPQEELQYLADRLGVKPKILEKGGHLNKRSGYTKFPLILEFLEK